MNSIMKTFLVGLVTLMVLSAWGADEAAVKKDMALLQGEWTMVSGSADGEAMPPQMLKEMKRVCKGDEATTTMSGQIYFKAKISIDPTKNPKTIDYDMNDGFTKGQKQLGIYEVEGDTFKACFGKPGAERPSDFKAGDGRTVSVWTREKAAAAAQPKADK
jgi:uncharacterized protein (TIGR03067 family)